MDLRIDDGLVIPEDELSWRFLPSGGPGGQHANRAATKAELSFDVAASRVFDAATRDRLIDRLESRLSEGVLTVREDGSRSQWRNRQAARARLAELLREAMRIDPPRRPTKPARAAKQRRLAAKRRRAETKRLRRRPEIE